MTLKSCRREIDMPVFDFSNTTEEKKACECTYTTFQSNENTASAKYPILVLDNTAKQWKYHSCGMFTNQTKRTAFEFTQEDGTVCADILRVDARFVNLLRWLGENHINVRLSGENTPDGYAVYKIREIAFGGGKKLSAEDGFLQFMMERLFASSAPSEEAVDEEQEEDGDDMKLTSIQSITDFMTCAGRTMPDNIRLWPHFGPAIAPPPGARSRHTCRRSATGQTRRCSIFCFALKRKTSSAPRSRGTRTSTHRWCAA